MALDGADEAANRSCYKIDHDGIRSRQLRIGRPRGRETEGRTEASVLAVTLASLID